METTKAMRNNVGIHKIHHSPESMNCMPMRISVPRLGLSAGRPMPRKDKVASSKMAEARSTVIITKSGPRMLGRICTNITREGRWPIMIAACTYSLFIWTKVVARAVRAKFTQSDSAIARVKLQRVNLVEWQPAECLVQSRQSAALLGSRAVPVAHLRYASRQHQIVRHNIQRQDQDLRL